MSASVNDPLLPTNHSWLVRAPIDEFPSNPNDGDIEALRRDTARFEQHIGQVLNNHPEIRSSLESCFSQAAAPSFTWRDKKTPPRFFFFGQQGTGKTHLVNNIIKRVGTNITNDVLIEGGGGTTAFETHIILSHNPEIAICVVPASESRLQHLLNLLNGNPATLRRELLRAFDVARVMWYQFRGNYASGLAQWRNAVYATRCEWATTASAAYERDPFSFHTHLLRRLKESRQYRANDETTLITQLRSICEMSEDIPFPGRIEVRLPLETCWRDSFAGGLTLVDMPGLVENDASQANFENRNHENRNHEIVFDCRYFEERDFCFLIQPFGSTVADGLIGSFLRNAQADGSKISHRAAVLLLVREDEDGKVLGLGGTMPRNEARKQRAKDVSGSLKHRPGMPAPIFVAHSHSEPDLDNLMKGIASSIQSVSFHHARNISRMCDFYLSEIFRAWRRDIFQPNLSQWISLVVSSNQDALRETEEEVRETLRGLWPSVLGAFMRRRGDAYDHLSFDLIIRRALRKIFMSKMRHFPSGGDDITQVTNFNSIMKYAVEQTVSAAVDQLPTLLLLSTLRSDASHWDGVNAMWGKGYRGYCEIAIQRNVQWFQANRQHLSTDVRRVATILINKLQATEINLATVQSALGNFHI